MTFNKTPCECGDKGCPACGANCDRNATSILFRVDQVDVTGTLMCEGCSDDAMESGLFEIKDFPEVNS